ncbi:MAG: GNAT family N-acetyltransferase [Bacteroidales bacterium]|nr:GNAT family N-acetyltransferase [Bacteroidales bacterium]
MKEGARHKSMIRYLHRGQIDNERWNRVIGSSGFETVYAQSWYLDACADNWGALILSDYEYVMPVAFRKKFGFKYIYQPRFCQQLGVYSEKQVDGQIIRMFLDALSENYKLGDYAFNEGNLLVEQEGFEVTDNTNYTLQMSSSYEELTLAYSSNCRRNVRKACQSGLEFSEDISIRELVLLKKQHDHTKQADEHYQLLINMFSEMQEAGNVNVFGVKLGSDLCAGAIFASCNKRVHYLLSVSTEEGREQSGMFYVIDKVIQINSGKELYLDFEGSNISSVARFFSGFGAQPQLYQRIRFSNAAGKFFQKVRSVRPD